MAIGKTATKKIREAQKTVAKKIVKNAKKK